RVDHQDTVRRDDDVVDVRSRARHAPIVQRDHRLRQLACKEPAESLFANGALTPGSRRLWIVAQRQEESAQASPPLGLDVLPPLGMETVVRLATGSAGRAGEFEREPGAATADQARRGLGLSIPPRLAPTLQLAAADAAAG